MSEREIYLVITQTGSIISRMLKKITGAEYNHISVSLESDLHCITHLGDGMHIFRGGAVL